MSDPRPIYENAYAYILRETIKGKLRYTVYRKQDRKPCFTYKTLEEARRYALHLESYRPLWES